MPFLTRIIPPDAIPTSSTQFPRQSVPPARSPFRVPVRHRWLDLASVRAVVDPENPVFRNALIEKPPRDPLPEYVIDPRPPQ